MSDENIVEGPLVMVDAAPERGWLTYDVPDKRCSECGRKVTPVTVQLYGGIHSGVTWLLRCTNGHEFTWDDYLCSGDDQYGCGDITCPAEQRRQQ